MVCREALGIRVSNTIQVHITHQGASVQQEIGIFRYHCKHVPIAAKEGQLRISLVRGDQELDLRSPQSLTVRRTAHKHQKISENAHTLITWDTMRSVISMACTIFFQAAPTQGGQGNTKV